MCDDSMLRMPAKLGAAGSLCATRLPIVIELSFGTQPPLAMAYCVGTAHTVGWWLGLQAASAFTSALDEALGALHGAFEPQMPDLEIISGIEAKPAALSKAAVREPVITHCNALLDGWSSIAKELLASRAAPSQVC